MRKERVCKRQEIHSHTLRLTSRNLVIQALSSVWRYGPVNAPRYDTNAEARNTSPTMRDNCKRVRALVGKTRSRKVSLDGCRAHLQETQAQRVTDKEDGQRLKHTEHHKTTQSGTYIHTHTHIQTHTCSPTAAASCFHRTPSEARPAVSFSARISRARVISLSLHNKTIYKGERNLGGTNKEKGMWERAAD